MADTPPENSSFDVKTDARREMPLTGSDPRFAAEEIIACASCSRSNPPNRTTCLYCGKPLDVSSIRTDLATVNYQRPEQWEDGFSLVYAGKQGLSNDVIDAAADLLQIDVETVNRLFEIGAPTPLIYLRSLPDARLLASRLSEKGFDCAVVGDDLLQAKTPPSRVRSIKFENDLALLEDFNTGRINEVKYGERVLFVAGSLMRTSTEVLAKISKKAIKNIEETHGFTEEAVVDIYPPADVYGFRVRSAGFDFSCLGERMQRFSGANMNELISELRSRFEPSTFIDSFSTVVPTISTVWPVEETRQGSNVSRGPLGGVQKQTLTVLDNTIQFTKFSRLQRHFV